MVAEPSLEYEEYRRRASRDVRELLNFVRGELNALAKHQGRILLFSPDLDTLRIEWFIAEIDKKKLNIDFSFCYYFVTFSTIMLLFCYLC